MITKQHKVTKKYPFIATFHASQPEFLQRWKKEFEQRRKNNSGKIKHFEVI